LSAPVSKFKEHDPTVLDHVKRFGEVFSQSSKSLSAQATTDEDLLYERVRDWIRYTKAANEYIDRYLLAEASTQEATNNLAAKKSRMDQIQSKNSSSGSSADFSKSREVQDEYVFALQAAEKATSIFDKFKSSLWSELSRFDRYKLLELRHWIDYYSQAQMKELGVLYQLWGSYVMALKQ